MELKKTNETISRSYDDQGHAADRVDSATYNIVDPEGNVIGSANIGQGYGNANIQLSNFSSIEEGEAKLKKTFGITE